MKKKILRIIMILMLVLMGSVSAVAQGAKIKKFSYAKSGEILRGGQLYARTRDSRSLEREQGYSAYSWILYLENGGTVQLELPDGQKHQVAPGMHSFTYHYGEKMYIDVRVVPYAVPYLGELRLQGAISNDSVHLEKTVSEEDFFTYTIKSDASLMQLIKIQSGGGREVNGNKGIYATIIKEFPQGNYRYAPELPHQELFAQGVSVQYLKEQAHNRGLDPNDFVLQIGLDCSGSSILFSEVYRGQAREELKTTFLRIVDKRQKYYTLKASSNDLALGSVEPAELKVKAGGEATFTATAKENAIFKGWKKGLAEVSVTESVLKLTDVQEASEWTAVFEKKEFEVKASSNDLALGTVEPAELKVKAGGEVTFTATAKENAIFKGWKKGLAEVSVTGSVLKLTNVQEASEWTAVFEKKEFEVKASSNDLTLGSVEPATLKVKAGGEVTFTATAKENAIFKGWKQKGSAEVSVTESVLKLTNVQEASEWTAVFEKKASTPEVGAVDLQFGQREAILTWAPGSATSWQIKLYRSDTKLVKTILTQLPRVELESLVPGEVYRYELVAKRQGKLDSQVKQGTFKTDQFNEREALAPYLKNFSKLLRGKAFDLIWMDVNLSEFDQETPIYEYYWQLNETSPKVLLIPDGKQLTLDTNQVGGCLIILIKSGDTLLYEVRYELDK